MYQNLANQNPIISQFNGYLAQNPQFTPFQNNHLINNNVHVMNNLNDLVQQHKTIQQNIPMYQQQYYNQEQVPNQLNNQFMQNNQANLQQNNKSSRTGVKNSNIIKEMLKPQKIVKDGKDVLPSFIVRKQVQKQAKKGNIGIKMTNAPYKSIIKDKIIKKNVDDVKEEDLLVHKVEKGIDDDIDRFNRELDEKEEEKEKINEELQIEFHIDNYDRHKKKFEYKETFIRNIAFEENTFDETKQDYIEFYKQKQKEAEEGQKLCDEILHNIIDEGIINKDELPTENTNVTAANDINLNDLMKNMNNDNNEQQKLNIQNERYISKTGSSTNITKRINSGKQMTHPVKNNRIGTQTNTIKRSGNNYKISNNKKIVDV